MPGWFFAFALMGVWVKQFGVSAGVLRRWAFVSSFLLAAIAGAATLEASTGWPFSGLDRGIASRGSDVGGIGMARSEAGSDL